MSLDGSLENLLKIKRIADSVMEVPDDQRDAFLEQACNGDTELVRDVMGLLNVTELPTADIHNRLFSPMQEPDAEEFSNRRIGPYQLKEELGRGGMGVVYRGLRDDGELKMVVAVKLVKRNVATPELISRFRRERQLLVDLRHPHIAHLLDAGSTEDGLPYFIMEFVDGIDIAEWCRARQTDLEENLTLFRKVLSAVALAHRKGVIHRDIKPSNVLVNSDGEPVLLDFGIAHRAASDGEPGLTRESHVVMTPAYAAPEQIYGQPATPRFDIFALGILLLEMHTGIKISRKEFSPITLVQAMIGSDVSLDRNLLANSRNEIPEDLGDFLIKALAEDPMQRFSSCDEMMTELDQLIHARNRVISAETQVPAKNARRVEVAIPGNVLAVDSSFYIERPPTEVSCYAQIAQQGALLRIKAPWQMGKTSLLLRINRHAEHLGYSTVLLNFQMIEERFLSNLDTFLKWFCAVISRKLRLPASRLNEYWDDIFGAKDNCTAYFEEVLLPEVDHLVLALDEVDRLFEHPEIARDFLSLLRVWHEQAKTSDAWANTRLIVLHSTEIYIPMDINQSPFNVGLPISLSEFTHEQSALLAARYQLDWTQKEIDHLVEVTGGHPHLTHLACHHVSNSGADLAGVLARAGTEEGLYAEHLKRVLRQLERQPRLADAMKRVVLSESPVRLDSEAAFKLKSMGLVDLKGNDVLVKRRLYQDYFRDRL